MYSQNYITEVSRFNHVYNMLNGRDLLYSAEECLKLIEIGYKIFALDYCNSYPDYIETDDFIILACYLYVHYTTKKAFKDIIFEAIELHKTKNAGYSGLHTDPWENFKAVEYLFGINALEGILARATDKYMRFMNIKENPELEQAQESLNDTLLDFAAYLIIYNCLVEEREGAMDMETNNEHIEPN